MATSKQERVLEQYQQRLKQLDEQHRLTQSLKINFPGINTINVLSIGCGHEPVELPALENFLEAKGFTLNYIGIDVEQNAIDDCNTRFAGPTSRFRNINGNNVDQIRRLFSSNIHIIVLRHPLLFEEFGQTKKIAEEFKTILTQAVPQLLANHGILLASIYLPEEKKSFEQMLTMVSSQPMTQLPANETIQSHTAYRPNFFDSPVESCKDIYYYDRYFLAIIDFKARPALLAEIQFGNFGSGVLEKYEAIVDNIKQYLFAEDGTTFKTKIIKIIALATHCILEQSDEEKALTALTNTLNDPDNLADTDLDDTLITLQNLPYQLNTFLIERHRTNEPTFSQLLTRLVDAIIKTGKYVKAQEDDETAKQEMEIYAAATIAITRPIAATTTARQAKPISKYDITLGNLGM